MEGRSQSRSMTQSSLFLSCTHERFSSFFHEIHLTASLANQGQWPRGFIVAMPAKAL